MNITKGVLVFIVFLVLVLIAGFFVQLPTPINEKQSNFVSGLIIQFRDGTSEQEAKTVLENYSMPEHKLDYNSNNIPGRYYIIVDKNKMMDLRDELRKKADWTDPAFPDIEKGSYYIITITEQAIQDKNFLAIVEKNNLQVKKFVWCHVHFGERPKSGISKERANELKGELEKNENIFLVEFQTIVT